MINASERDRILEAWDQIIIYATDPDDDTADLHNILMSWIAHVDGVPARAIHEHEAAIERQREKSLQRQKDRDSG